MLFNFSHPYDRDSFLPLLQMGFLPTDIVWAEDELELEGATQVGRSKSLSLPLYEIWHEGSTPARYLMRQSLPALLRERGEQRALLILSPKDGNGEFRLALMELEGGKVRWQAYVLGWGSVVHRAQHQLLGSPPVSKLEELRLLFSAEQLTRDFYGEVAAWYARALPQLKLKAEASDTQHNEALIRLLTHELFGIFLRELGHKAPALQLPTAANLPAVLLDELHALLSKYPLCARENTPEEQELALDPELLGKAFENLLACYAPETSMSAREQTGSFYTPREIVHYIINTSLQSYLSQRLGGEHEATLIALLNEHELRDENLRAPLLDALLSVRLIDPACGSGAFNLGALQTLTQLLGLLDPQGEALLKRAPELTDIPLRYAHKLYATQKLIYGVDIQPLALHIAQLRLYLSLMLELPAESTTRPPAPHELGQFSCADALNPEQNWCAHEGAFDIVLGNPPYIEAKAMARLGMTAQRDRIKKQYKSIKGSWDIYLAFMERGLEQARYTLCFITPDKWLSKPFAAGFRQLFMLPRLRRIVHAGNRVFDGATVDAIVSLFEAQSRSIEACTFASRSRVEPRNSITSDSLPAPYLLDSLFSPHHALIRHMEAQASMRLGDIATCEKACATDNAYQLRALVQENFAPDAALDYRLINTGTLGRFAPQWGDKKMRYLKADYQHPTVSRAAFEREFAPAYIRKAAASKLILKGINRLEGFVDAHGNYLPAISTLVLCSDEVEKLYLLCGLLHSRLFHLYVTSKYASSSYCGGISFECAMLNDFPLPPLSDTFQQEMGQLVQQLHAQGSPPSAAQEQQLNALVNGLYDLPANQGEEA